MPGAEPDAATQCSESDQDSVDTEVSTAESTRTDVSLACRNMGLDPAVVRAAMAARHAAANPAGATADSAELLTSDAAAVGLGALPVTAPVSADSEGPVAAAAAAATPVPAPLPVAASTTAAPRPSEEEMARAHERLRKIKKAKNKREKKRQRAKRQAIAKQRAASQPPNAN